jgi:hypothetical protein
MYPVSLILIFPDPLVTAHAFLRLFRLTLRKRGKRRERRGQQSQKERGRRDERTQLG